VWLEVDPEPRREEAVLQDDLFPEKILRAIALRLRDPLRPPARDSPHEECHRDPDERRLQERQDVLLADFRVASVI